MIDCPYLYTENGQINNFIFISVVKFVVFVGLDCIEPIGFHFAASLKTYFAIRILNLSPVISIVGFVILIFYL